MFNGCCSKAYLQITASLECWRSVLNWQKCDVSFFKVGETQIELLHERVNIWLLSMSSSGRVQVCHSLGTNVSSVKKRCLKAFYIYKITQEQVQEDHDYNGNCYDEGRWLLTEDCSQMHLQHLTGDMAY